MELFKLVPWLLQVIDLLAKKWVVLLQGSLNQILPKEMCVGGRSPFLETVVSGTATQSMPDTPNGHTGQ